MLSVLLGLLLGSSPQAPSVQAKTKVIAILAERSGDEVSLRFVLNGFADSYSASREGAEVVVRFSAEPKPEAGIPVAVDPIKALALGTEAMFSLRVSVPESWSHEMLREASSLRLVLHPRAAPPVAEPSPAGQPPPQPTRTPEATAADTADLYRRLFPSVTDGVAPTPERTEAMSKQNWYSDFTWGGLQAKPWVSVSYINGKTTLVDAKQVTSDGYWVIQPNLGIGLTPHIGSGEGQWKVNYSPRFRRSVDFALPGLTSHFVDVGIDQTLSSLGSIYGTYHYSQGILETEEVDPGREYGIGLNRVIDTSLQRFRRQGFGLGVHFDFLADTQVDIGANTSRLKFGNDPKDANLAPGPRAFFNYDTRSVNASIRHGAGEGRFLSFVFGATDTPAQTERKQIEGRGYTYGASIDGEIAALTTGRLMFGYRTQKNPNAGAGGRDYKDVNYGAQVVRQFSDEWNLGLSADRKLYVSAFADNGFYVADGLRGDLNGRLPLAFFIRGSVGLQVNNYKASPQVEGTTSILRKDKLRSWSIGLSRNIFSWAYLRADYTSERRNSNLNRFDINTRALTVQLALGFFGKPERQAH